MPSIFTAESYTSISTLLAPGVTLLKYSAPRCVTCSSICPPSGAFTWKRPCASLVVLTISSMLCAVLMTAIVSPADGLPVVRSVTTPVSGAANAVAVHSIMQASRQEKCRRKSAQRSRASVAQSRQGQWVQFSIVRLGMRLNSRSLFVTSVSPS
jgi:hypothetical protein